MAKASEKTILIVDDEPDVREFLSACIKDAGFQVKTAEDGVDGLEKIEKYMPDLVTVDMVMPRRSGINLIRKLKKDKNMASIPVIVITAHAQDEFGQEDISKFEGFATHLKPRYIMEKPITPANLRKAICNILDVEPVEDDTAREESSEHNAVMDALKNADKATIEKISQMLNA
ncbi:MAG: response regulator [Deltaproteobacteria bacterium]|jgi:CheY-like chemotaxis protein|nr:response regulator [Deltaproteobacteria bacterium]